VAAVSGLLPPLQPPKAEARPPVVRGLHHRAQVRSRAGRGCPREGRRILAMVATRRRRTGGRGWNRHEVRGSRSHRVLGPAPAPG